MAITDNLQEKVAKARSQGYTDAQITTYLTAKGVGPKVASLALSAAAANEQAQKASSPLQIAKDTAIGVRDTLLPTPSSPEDALSKGLIPVKGPFTGRDIYIDPTGSLAIGEAAKVGATVVKDVANAAVRTGGEVIDTVAAGAKKLQEAVQPTKTADEAIAQIGQGKTDTLKSVKTALETIDTKDVHTYQDLLSRIDSSIPNLARQVDTELVKDPTRYSLKDLSLTSTSKGGTPVTTDFVTRALDDLKNLYSATGDDLARTNIEEIIAHARDNGLTRKEVNDISRVYGQEFSQKAFSKTGEPLTSTNAQAFETTRSGLKDVARQGLGGPEAQALDAKLSALYDTKKLVQRNVEAVQKLQQRIQERGLVEKAGYYVAKYADILTGGSLRGFIGGILPRGAGYKVMNALDVEQALRSNLDIVEKALAESTDEGLVKVLQNADETFKSGPKASSQ